MKCEWKIESIGDKFQLTCVECGTSLVSSRPSLYRKCVADSRVQAGYWADMSCQHRGEVLRQIECRTCGNRGKMVDVHYCAVHGECTLKRAVYLEKPHVCLGCDSHVHSK